MPNYKLHIKVFISFSFFGGTLKFSRDKHDFIFSMGKPTSKPMLSCSFPSSCFFFFSKSLSYLKDEASKQNPLFWSWFHSSSNLFSLYRNLRSAFNTRWCWNLFTKFRLETYKYKRVEEEQQQEQEEETRSYLAKWIQCKERVLPLLMKRKKKLSTFLFLSHHLKIQRNKLHHHPFQTFLSLPTIKTPPSSPPHMVK